MTPFRVVLLADTLQNVRFCVGWFAIKIQVWKWRLALWQWQCDSGSIKINLFPKSWWVSGREKKRQYAFAVRTCILIPDSTAVCLWAAPFLRIRFSRVSSPLFAGVCCLPFARCLCGLLVHERTEEFCIRWQKRAFPGDCFSDSLHDYPVCSAYHKGSAANLCKGRLQNADLLIQ